MKYFIANWKAHKTIFQSVEWIQNFTKYIKASPSVMAGLSQDKIQIIICPPFPYIPLLHQYAVSMKTLHGVANVYVGAQDVSQCKDGSYTGEVTATMLQELVNFAIVGHSERRANFKEEDTMLQNKVSNLAQVEIKSILCIGNEQESIFENASIVAFEPLESIGSGQNMGATEVIRTKQGLKLHPGQAFVYGGSVTSEDCIQYLQSNEIDGLLIGKASLDPKEFARIIEVYGDILKG